MSESDGAGRTLWRERLNAIERDCQKTGWDSYNAHPVSPAALAAVRKLCERMDVIPHNGGGVSIQLAGEAIDIEIDKEGRIGPVWVDVHDVEEWLTI